MTSEAEAESQSSSRIPLCWSKPCRCVCFGAMVSWSPECLWTWYVDEENPFNFWSSYLYLQCYDYKCVPPCIVSGNSNPGLHAYQVSLLLTSNERWSGEAQGQDLQFKFLVEKPDSKVLSCIHYDCVSSGVWVRLAGCPGLGCVLGTLVKDHLEIGVLRENWLR